MISVSRSRICDMLRYDTAYKWFCSCIFIDTKNKQTLIAWPLIIVIALMASYNVASLVSAQQPQSSGSLIWKYLSPDLARTLKGV